MVAPLVKPPPAPIYPGLNWRVDQHGYLSITLETKVGIAGAKEDSVNRIWLSPDDTDRLAKFIRETEPLRVDKWKRR
jgi:hypothetical protein